MNNFGRPAVDKSGGDTFGESGGFSGAGSITKGGAGVGAGGGYYGSGTGTGTGGGEVWGGFDGSNEASVTGGSVTGPGSLAVSA